VAVRVGEHLDLDVPRPLDVLLDPAAVVAERRERSRLHEASASTNSGDFVTTRMPLPPPPALA